MSGGIKIDGIDKIIIKRLVEDARTPVFKMETFSLLEGIKVVLLISTFQQPRELNLWP